MADHLVHKLKLIDALPQPDNKNLRLLMIIIIAVHLSVAIAMKVLFFSYVSHFAPLHRSN